MSEIVYLTDIREDMEEEENERYPMARDILAFLVSSGDASNVEDIGYELKIPYWELSSTLRWLQKRGLVYIE